MRPALCAFLSTVLSVLVIGCEEEEPPVAVATESRAAVASATSLPTATPTLDERSFKQTVIAQITPLPTEAPPPPPAVYPIGTRAGIREVDAVIAAVAAKDGAALAALVGFVELPCEAPGTVQPQPLRCREGMTVGALLIGFPVADVEGGLWPADRVWLASAFDRVLNRLRWELHAVYRCSGACDDIFSARHDYLVTFGSWAAGQGPLFNTFGVREGAVVSLAFGFPPLEPKQGDNPADPGWLLARAE
ncbi:MAG: hypothetical protein ACR2HN_02345 [Tepidiformaceae bacterium]